MGMLNDIMKTVSGGDPGENMRTVWANETTSTEWNRERAVFGDRAAMSIKETISKTSDRVKRALNIFPLATKEIATAAVELPINIATWTWNRVAAVIAAPILATGTAAVLASRYIAEAPNYVPIAAKGIRDKLTGWFNKIPTFNVSPAPA